MAVRCLFAVLPLVCDALRLGRKGQGAKANVTAVGEGDAGALLQRSRLWDMMYPYRLSMYFGAGAYIRSGPRSVSMPRGGTPGQTWDVAVGSQAFTISIEDGAGNISWWLDELARVPPEIRRGYEIASQYDGVGIYYTLGGACGHGGYNYINLERRADSGCAAHEAGHTLDQHVTRNFESNLMGQFGAAGDRDGISVSEYGDNNVYEGWAEFAKCYAWALAGGYGALQAMHDASPQRWGLFEHALYRAGSGSPKLPMCWCRTPNQGTVNYNGFSCNDGSTGWCEAHQTCYDDGWWNQGEYPCRSESVSQCRWRQTGNCDPYGPREPHLDQDCGAQMPTGSSGFCDCNGNDYLDSNEYGYGCSSSPGRCDSVCR